MQVGVFVSEYKQSSAPVYVRAGGQFVKQCSRPFKRVRCASCAGRKPSARQPNHNASERAVNDSNAVAVVHAYGPVGYSSRQMKYPVPDLDVNQISRGSAAGFKGMKMMLTFWSNGREPSRYGPCRLMVIGTLMQKSCMSPSEILGAQIFRLFTSG
jgi:hypothetical protein